MNTQRGHKMVVYIKISFKNFNSESFFVFYVNPLNTIQFGHNKNKYKSEIFTHFILMTNMFIFCSNRLVKHFLFSFSLFCWSFAKCMHQATHSIFHHNTLISIYQKANVFLIIIRLENVE